jgi:hypothetical protein
MPCVLEPPAAPWTPAPWDALRALKCLHLDIARCALNCLLWDAQCLEMSGALKCPVVSDMPAGMPRSLEMLTGLKKCPAPGMPAVSGKCLRLEPACVP